MSEICGRQKHLEDEAEKQWVARREANENTEHVEVNKDIKIKLSYYRTGIQDQREQ